MITVLILKIKISLIMTNSNTHYPQQEKYSSTNLEKKNIFFKFLKLAIFFYIS